MKIYTWAEIGRRQRGRPKSARCGSCNGRGFYMMIRAAGVDADRKESKRPCLQCKTVGLHPMPLTEVIL